MNWKPRIYWLSLALFTALVAWQLTRWITHVDRDARAQLTVILDEASPLTIDLTHVTITGLLRNQFRVPGIVFLSEQRAMVVVTPSLRSITLPNLSRDRVTCGFSDRTFTRTSLAVLSEMTKDEALKPITLSAAGSRGTLIPVPSELQTSLAHLTNGQGTILCTFSGQLAARPTFTERSVTVDAQNGRGYVIFDISALEDVDDLRFFGGLALPLAGERARLLNSTNNIISAEWVDVAASERRDIFLVIIGGLAAIAAAMAIEAIRPFIER